jgi:NYN domain
MLRAALYVDGFNLYHAIEDLGQNHLKWLDMSALGRLLIPKQTQTLVRVVWCTAVRTDNPQKMLRHREYIRALKGTGVTCLEGHFAGEDRNCRSCGNTWKAPVEKQGDVNLAITMLDDAHCDLFDHAYLLTSDSDQAATVRLLKERFPGKPVTTVCAPGRSHCKEIIALTPLKIALSAAHLERCLFPKHLVVDGKPIANRHPSYDPPKGWKAPVAETVAEEAGALSKS